VADDANGTIDARDEQIELYVLGLLDDGETAAVERLLREDPAARRRVRELRDVVSALAYSVEPVEPSPDLKSRIMAAAHADLTPEPAPPAPPISLADRREQRERGIARFTPWLVAAILAFALVASLAWNLELRSELDDEFETTTYTVVGSGPAESVAGALVVVDEDTAVLNLVDLQPLPPDRTYQVWLIHNGTPVPNVLFVPNEDGIATVTIPGELDNYSTLAITVEPQTGSMAPTTNPIITSDLTQAT
jgi:anti-sigma-K factor RskA